MGVEKIISLGFSCQSKFTSNIVCGDFQSLPFDSNITTKDFVLKALDQGNGQLFMREFSELEHYQMPQEKTQGLHKDGIWFWHDFPRNGNDLADGYQASVNLVEKYAYLWKRFINRLEDRGPKRFLVSNTQKNLVEFASDQQDFTNKFGFDIGFYNNLCAALDKLGVENYRVTFLVRTLEEYRNLCNQPGTDRLDLRYGGVLNLNYNPLIASSLVSPEHQTSTLDQLCGNYDKGYVVEKANHDSVVINDGNGKAVAVGRSFYDGFIFGLVGLTDGIMKVIFENDCLIFNDAHKTTLRKL